MVLPLYLAMTPAEMTFCRPLPQNSAYMSCHFSILHPGLSDLPEFLPEGSILMIDDLFPMNGHDPEQIADQLLSYPALSAIDSLILDFQRPDHPDIEALAAYLIRHLPCPVAVSALYGRNLDCPVLLPPVPPDVLPKDHFAQWKSREIWLEVGLEALQLRLHTSGCERTVISLPTIPKATFSDTNLHCHYLMELSNSSVDFTLFRNTSDWDTLLKTAKAYGVTRCIGLWQEFYGKENNVTRPFSPFFAEII